MMTPSHTPSAGPACMLCGQPMGGGCTCSQYTDVTRIGTRDADTGAWTVQHWPDVAPRVA